MTFREDADEFAAAVDDLKRSFKAALFPPVERLLLWLNDRLERR